MLALHLTLLTDRYAATRFNDRAAGEWPPHPARVYSALVDALYADSDTPDAVEVEAVDRLAGLGVPSLLASEASYRRVVINFVPVNDVNQVADALPGPSDKLEAATAALAAAELALVDADAKAQAKAQKAVEKASGGLVKAQAAFDVAQRAATAAPPEAPKGNTAGAVLPWGRTKQPRTFPAVVPTAPDVVLWWPDADDAVDLDALNAVAARVARVGHSSSFVHLRFTADFVPDDADPRMRFTPDPDGDHVLRVPTSGQRAALFAAWERHHGDQPGRVMPGGAVRYRTGVQASQMRSERSGGRWVSWRLATELALPLHAAGPLMAAVRGALMSHATEPVHAMLSGHDADGPLGADHLAVLPLAFVAHPHADGLVRGFAVSLPAAAGRDAERALLQAIGRWEASSLAAAPDADGAWAELGVAGQRLLVERVVDAEDAIVSLRAARWSSARRRWASVTPVALDGECGPFDHPSAAQRRKAWKTAEKQVRRAAWYALSPEARARVSADEIEVAITLDPPVVGAASLRHHPRFQRAGHARPRRLVHAHIRYPEPVVGPLVLGAGRHFGLGLCVPLSDRPDAEAP